MQPTTAPSIKRTVDLVDRAPEDEFFTPQASNSTLFHHTRTPAHNVVQEIVDLGYRGNAAWGQRITVNLRRSESGDIVQWLCLRLTPRSWLPSDVEESIRVGDWDYADTSGAWTWASSLATQAIQRVEFESGDTLLEAWGGEWMDVWSRIGMDVGRAATWDADIYGQMPPWALRDVGRPAWTATRPTEDGHVYCWLPLALFRHPRTGLPLLSIEEKTQEVRVHITLRPFADVVRRRAVVRATPCEVPLGSTQVFLDVTGGTPIPWVRTLDVNVPGFEEVSVLAGVIHTDGARRTSLMRMPQELLFEPVSHAQFDNPGMGVTGDGCVTVTMNLTLTTLNGPIREIVWFLRRKGVWAYAESTNYGALLEDALVATATTPLTQRPLMTKARLRVDNATWREEDEVWWRMEYGLGKRGGVRAAGGMVYGFSFGEAARWSPDSLQPAGTINGSKVDVRLDIDVDASLAPEGWEVHVFGVGVNWLRFTSGQAGLLFSD